MTCLNKTVSASIPNFTDVRKSLEPQTIKSFRESTEVVENGSRRENIMSRRKNNLEDLKITPLNERKSLTRRMRMNTLTRVEERDPGLINELQNFNKPKPEPAPVPFMNNLTNEKLNDESIEVGEKDLLNNLKI